MSIRILSGVLVNEDERPAACLYDSTSNIAFGPLFQDEEAANAFVEWFERNHAGAPRHLSLSYLINHADQIYQHEYLPELRAREAASG